MKRQDEPNLLEELGALTKLGDGGQGNVHRAALLPGTLYKAYHSPTQLNVAELKRLIRLVHHDPIAEGTREHILASTAWPNGVVLENGTHTGLTMPEAPARFSVMIQGGTRLRELQFLIFEKKAMWADLQLPDADQRRELLIGYARLFKALHSLDIIIGDVSPRNLLWSIDPYPAVYALDCDGCRINGHPAPMPQAQTPDWADPDQEVGVATFATDRFKLALLIIRVLLVEPKVTPRDVALDPIRRARLGDRIADLAVRVADGERCLAEEWLNALDNRPTITFDQVRPPEKRERPKPDKGPDRPVIDFD